MTDSTTGPVDSSAECVGFLHSPGKTPEFSHSAPNHKVQSCRLSPPNSRLFPVTISLWSSKQTCRLLMMKEQMLQQAHLWPGQHSGRVNADRDLRQRSKGSTRGPGVFTTCLCSAQLSQCSLAFSVTKVGFLFQKFQAVIITVNSTGRKEAPWEQSLFTCSDGIEPVWIYGLLDMEVLPLL